MKPLVIDLFCGLGGWAEGFLAEGWRVIGYDIEAHAIKGQDFTRIAGAQNGVKTIGHANKRDGHSHTRRLTNQAESDGVKQGGISGLRANGKGDRWFQDGAARLGSKRNGRKAASAMIAKIPFALAQWIARTYKPKAK